MAQTEKVCFDRLLPHDLHRPHAGRMMALAVGPTRAAFEIAKLWPNGTALSIRFVGGTPAQHDVVKQFAPQWCDHANLSFAFNSSPSAQIRIAFADDGAWSYIGKDALGIPSNQPTMNFGWLDEGVVLHEFGHMIGMIHEHQNPRTNPIQWNKPVVNAALAGPPNNWDPETIQHNLYDKYEVTQINGSDFDPASVMLYSFPAAWTINGFHTEPNEKLGAVDKAFASRVYPRSASPGGPPVVELPVLEGHEGEIGQPAEEDLYTFKAARAGRYTVETTGQTDLVMSLLGPSGSQIAQDDDNGEGRNPKIEANLAPGTYKVQVRHYNTAGGTGKYRIRVLK